MKKDSGYNTKQKENLLSYLMKNKDKHTNVQEISAFLSAEGTPVGVATITDSSTVWWSRGSCVSTPLTARPVPAISI